MRNTFFSILLIWLALFAFASNTIAQDSPQWHLPEGAKARLGKGGINEIAYSPDGTRLAVASSIGIWLYDARTGEELKLLSGHTSGVWSISFSPDGSTLASGSGDATVRLWSVGTGRHLRTLEGHTSGVWSVWFSPDGLTLASGSSDTTVRLWDVGTGRHLRTLEGHTSLVESVSFSPDGLTLASGSWDGTVLLWELAPTPVESKQIAADVNKDGIVNIIDLTLVASNFGKTGQNSADVNGDGVVNIIDLTLVAGAFGNTSAAPSIWNLDQEIAPTSAEVEQWLHEARQVNLTDPVFQRGLLMLERLLATLTPKETALLPNYPNPFNPETWIPYQLSESAEVSISIYAADGRLVRTLDLGHRSVGNYESRSRAAYWDGRNDVGESVASSVYFYTLTAGDFTATRKMLILK